MKKLWRRYVTKSSKAPNEYEVEWRPAPVSFNISVSPIPYAMAGRLLIAVLPA
jgi:hypothetical protein